MLQVEQRNKKVFFVKHKKSTKMINRKEIEKCDTYAQ